MVGLGTHASRTAAASLSQYGRNVDPRLGIDIDLAERRLAQTALALLSLPHGTLREDPAEQGRLPETKTALPAPSWYFSSPIRSTARLAPPIFAPGAPDAPPPPEARMRTGSGGAGASSYCSGTLEAKCQVIAKQRMQIAIDTNPYAVYRSIVPRRSVANIHPLTPTITTTHQARSKTWTGDSRLSFSCQRR